MKYHWNAEISAHLNKKNKSEILVLLLMILFLAANVYLYLMERNLRKISEQVNQTTANTLLEEEYYSLMGSSSFVDEKRMKEHFGLIKNLRCNSARIEDNKMILSYSGYSIAELEDEISLLKEKYQEVQVERIDENDKNLLVSIEVRI
ncbi:MAG: hypothetical protein Q4D65_04380 [Peptostreptococcaceae bacterium]|nr:hypothetical protein [Peptostreptococcaceae bacterium]